MFEEKTEKESVLTDGGVDFIREGLRELTSAERKQHRQLELNKNRVALGEIPEDSKFTPAFVVEKAKALKKKTLKVDEYRHLQNALLQDEENVNSFLKVDNILFALVRDLSGNNPGLQLCAANCCCNLALGNSKACTALAKSIAPYLITELETLNSPLLEVCAWTIGNLVTGSSKAFEIFHAQGCLKYITSLIHNCDETILPSVTYVTVHYVHAGFNQIVESEMIELVQAITNREFPYKDPYHIWLLALLSSTAACNTYLHRIVPLVVDYLYQNTINNFVAVLEVTASLRILGNIISESSGEAANILFKNSKYTEADLQTLLNTLLSHPYIHIRKETLWIIGNLYNHYSPDIKQRIKDLLPLLSHLNQAMLSLTQQIT